MFERGVITFDESSKEEMLAIFGKILDKQGYIIDEHTKKRELATDGKEIKLDGFAGIMRGKNGEPVLIRNDLASLIEMSDYFKSKEKNGA